jgi:hypothetical protein
MPTLMKMAKFAIDHNFGRTSPLKTATQRPTPDHVPPVLARS